MADTFLEHLTVEGERWDQLAWRYYGDAFAYGPIVAANPQAPIRPLLPAGLRLRIPAATSAAVTPAGLPPWKRGGVDG